MDMQVQGSRVESSLPKKYIQSVAIVRQNARCVIQLNAAGKVQKIKRNSNPSLNVIAVTIPHNGAGTRHVLVLEVGLRRHHPYARTGTLPKRVPYRTLTEKELQSVIPILEEMIDTWRQVIVAGWKVVTPVWVPQSAGHWKHFEKGVRVSVSSQDESLLNTFLGADLRYRRVVYPVDFHRRIIQSYLRGYKGNHSHMSRKMIKLRKAIEIYSISVSPFVKRYVVGSGFNASLLSMATGEDVEWQIPSFVPLSKICVRFVKRELPKGKKHQNRKFVSFEALSGDAEKMMRYFRSLPSIQVLYKNAPDGFLEQELEDRLQAAISKFEPPVDFI